MSPVSPVSPVSGLAENLSIFLAKSGYQSMMDPGQDGQDRGGQDGHSCNARPGPFGPGWRMGRGCPWPGQQVNKLQHKNLKGLCHDMSCIGLCMLCVFYV